MDRLVDSLAVGLLRQLGRTRPVGVVRQTGLGAGSLPALRAFLQAEQHFRQGLWDSAQAYAEQAVAFDSTFALAYKRLSAARSWQPGVAGGESLSNVYSMRAAALNRGLPPRDSLLILVDGIFRSIALVGKFGPASPVLAARALAISEEAVQRYPDDPEAWSALGEARLHLGGSLVRTGGWRAALEAFERSIALDSLFAPAYIHPVEVSYALGDTARGRRFAEVLIRHKVMTPGGLGARGLEPLLQLVASRDTAAQERLLDTLPVEVIERAAGPLSRWVDSAELGIRLKRHFLRVDNPDALAWAKRELGWELAFRGHIREALVLTDTLSQVGVGEASLLGYVPGDRAAARFCAWLRSHWDAAFALAWWGAHHDTLSLRRFVRLADSAARAQSSTADSFWSPPLAAFGRAHLALARRDTAAALRMYDSLLAVPTPFPWWCQTDRLLAARFLADRGLLKEAARTLNDPPTLEGEIMTRPSDVLWYLERGRVAERLDDRPRALEAYRYVTAAWLHADPELQPYVAEARAGLERLTAERE
jgi:serine/threonine-protein kinase